MPYTNKGFTGNDGSEGAGWDPLEVQHFKDIENCLVSDAVGGVKDVGGHKHLAVYNQAKTMVLQGDNNTVLTATDIILVTNGPINAQKALNCNGPIIVGNPFISTKTGASGQNTESVDCSIYNRFSWRPSNTTGSGTLTVSLSNPIEGMLFYVNNYANTWTLAIGGHNISDCPGPVQAIMMYDNGGWRMMSLTQEG